LFGLSINMQCVLRAEQNYAMSFANTEVVQFSSHNFSCVTLTEVCPKQVDN
jgi:hypothetical protein